MSLSPVTEREVLAQGADFSAQPRSSFVETVQVGKQLVPLDGSNKLRKALLTYSASASLKYTRCHKQQDIALEDGSLYVCPVGAFEYKEGTLVSHFVWLPCVLTLGDSNYYVKPGQVVSVQAPPKLYLDTLVRAHTPFVTSSELDDLFMEGRPLCGYVVNNTTYAVARHSLHFPSHLQCILCEENFDSIQTWASHYSVRVATIPLNTFIAGQRLDDKPLPIPMFSQSRFPSSSEEHSPLCDTEDILASNLCGFHVKRNTFAVATYRHVANQILLGCIDPFCKRLFASVQEWAVHARIAPAPMRPFRRGLRLGERIHMTTTLPRPHSTHTSKSLADDKYRLREGLRPGELCRLHAPPLPPFKSPR